VLTNVGGGRVAVGRGYAAWTKELQQLACRGAGIRRSTLLAARGPWASGQKKKKKRKNTHPHTPQKKKKNKKKKTPKRKKRKDKVGGGGAVLRSLIGLGVGQKSSRSDKHGSSSKWEGGGGGGGGGGLGLGSAAAGCVPSGRRMVKTRKNATRFSEGGWSKSGFAPRKCGQPASAAARASMDGRGLTNGFCMKTIATQQNKAEKGDLCQIVGPCMLGMHPRAAMRMSFNGLGPMKG